MHAAIYRKCTVYSRSPAKDLPHFADHSDESGMVSCCTFAEVPFLRRGQGDAPLKGFSVRRTPSPAAKWAGRQKGNSPLAYDLGARSDVLLGIADMQKAPPDTLTVRTGGLGASSVRTGMRDRS